MPRTPNRPLRRHQIAQGLLDVMAVKGYEGATISDVARAARLAPGLVHYHFANKEEVLLEAVALLAARLSSRVGRAIADAGGSPTARLGAFIDAHLKFQVPHEAEDVACWVQVGAEAIRRPPVARALAGALGADADRLTALIVEAAPHRAVRRAASDAAAILAAIHGYFDLAFTAQQVVPRGSAARQVRRMASALVGVDLNRARS
jgi:TetR/AcrR family transcriptional repressor of bet genes